MRYIEPVDEKDDLLEADRQVREINTIPSEEGEIMDTEGSTRDALDLHATGTWMIMELWRSERHVLHPGLRWVSHSLTEVSNS